MSNKRPDTDRKIIIGLLSKSEFLLNYYEKNFFRLNLYYGRGS